MEAGGTGGGTSKRRAGWVEAGAEAGQPWTHGVARLVGEGSRSARHFLSQLTNYNPSDVEQLAKAAEQVVSDQGGPATAEKSGSLPRLLAHLKTALGKKTEEQAPRASLA